MRNNRRIIESSILSSVFLSSRLPARDLSLTLPPAPNSLAPDPRLNRAKDAQQNKQKDLHVLAETERVQAKGWQVAAGIDVLGRGR